MTENAKHLIGALGDVSLKGGGVVSGGSAAVGVLSDYSSVITSITGITGALVAICGLIITWRYKQKEYLLKELLAKRQNGEK
jgi:hypothetical protein